MKSEDNHRYSAEEFYSCLKESMTQITPSQYALVSLDLDNFNFINDLYGYEIGDIVLARLEKHFERGMKEGEFFCRLHADCFIFWLKNEPTEPLEQHLRVITNLRSEFEDILPVHYSFVCSGGIVYVDDLKQDNLTLMDKANYARKQAKGNHISTFLVYDKKMEEELNWKKIITLSMENALSEQEFEMYLQPKILMKTNQVAGAEALVRWNNKDYGMIQPDNFIPVLEQNGFIQQLDFFMLKQACLFLKKCMTQGLPVLPISVNFSKVHTRTPNFVEHVFEIVSALQIPTRLIEIELTESIFVGDFQKLLEISAGLKCLGFKVSLDDFGSAYSSLNHLKDLPLDIIKIDKVFLSSFQNDENGRIIIAKIIELIKSLHMTCVMEGIESNDQMEFLQKLCCDLGQGYFYAKPMRVQEYEKFMQSRNCVQEIEMCVQEIEMCVQEIEMCVQEIEMCVQGIEMCVQAETESTDTCDSQTSTQEFQMDNWELHVLDKTIDMGLMKVYLADGSRIQYVNERALEYLGYTRQEFTEQPPNSILDFIHTEDRLVLQSNIDKSIATGKPLQLQTRAMRKDGKTIVLQGRVSYDIDKDGQPIGLYAFQDITQEMEEREALRLYLEGKIEKWKAKCSMLQASEQRYKLIIEHSGSIMFEWNFHTNLVCFSENEDGLIWRDENWDDLTIENLFLDRIHVEDRPVYEQWICNVLKEAGKNEAELRVKVEDEQYIWIKVNATTICDATGTPYKAVGLYSDISEQKAAFDTLKIKSQLDPLTKLYNKEEAQRRITLYLKEYPEKLCAFFIVDVDNFKGVNDNLGHQFGDTVLKEVSQKIREIFRETDIVGRLGGDEFVICMLDLDKEEAITTKAALLVKHLRSNYFGSNTKYRISVSVGVACYPLHGTVFDELYRFADIALYESKERGKDCYTIYQECMAVALEDNRTPVEFSERFLNAYYEGDPVFDVFQMLYETKDVAASIQKILGMVGARFQVDRVYIFEYSEDRRFMSNTYEWCANGISAQIENLKNFSVDDLQLFLSTYNAEGIMRCNDISLMDEVSYEILKQQEIKSCLQCAIHDEGSMTGFIGFDSCRKLRDWRGDEIAVLGYISRILSVFLSKKQVKQELMKWHIDHERMLENLNGYVYVIHRESHEILYLNNATRRLGVKLGEICYKAAFGRIEACDNCPAKKLSKEEPYAMEEIYSVRLNKWVNSAVSLLHWGNSKEAVLVCCTDISKYKNENCST